MTEQKDEMDDLIKKLKERGDVDELCAAAATHLADQHAMWKDLKLKLEQYTCPTRDQYRDQLIVAKKRVKELEEHTRRLAQGDSEHYWEEQYRNEVATAKQERDDALERLKEYRRLKTRINYKELLRKYISALDNGDAYYAPLLTSEEQEIIEEIEREAEEESSLYEDAKVVVLKKRIRELEAKLSSSHDATRTGFEVR